MKTADLIPFILIELNESDKYGFELTKDIETKSNGKIVIKQPTLYTVLKKLEKSKFISSYWQDSEIGGKRHYYKITNNGKLQLSTLPSYDVLLNNLDKEENAEETELEAPKVEPLESIMPSSEVFASTQLDNSTELTINKENAELLTPLTNDMITQTPVNEMVKATPETVETQPQTDNKDKKDTIELVNLNYDLQFNNDIKYQEYHNIKQSEEYIKIKSTRKFIILKTLTLSMIWLVATLFVHFITNKTGKSPLFLVYFISAILIFLFYPIIVGLKFENLLCLHLNKKYKIVQIA